MTKHYFKLNKEEANLEYWERKKIPENIIAEAHELVLMNSGQIAESMFQPQGLWFFIQKGPDGSAIFSSLLTQNTRLNSDNFAEDEWVVSFTCSQDLTDVPAGKEILYLTEWISTEYTEDIIKDLISFPGGK